MAKTVVSGGGGSGGHATTFKSSRANAWTDTATVIADGATVGIPFDNLPTDPDDTLDYELVNDNGDGTVGLQVDTDGLYISHLVLNPITLIGGTIEIFIDLPIGFGRCDPSEITLNPTESKPTSRISIPFIYFTRVSAGLDAIGVFIANHSGASITIPGSSVHLYLYRIAPSPTP